MFACLLGLPSHGEVRWGPGPAAQWLWWGLLPTSPALFLDRLSRMVASGFRSRWLSWALLRWPRSAARSALGWSALFSRLCPCVCCFCLLSGPLSLRPLWLVRQLPSVPSGPRHRWQGPRCAVRVAASCATHTPGSRCTEPLPGRGRTPSGSLDRAVQCGDPVCVHDCGADELGARCCRREGPRTCSARPQAPAMAHLGCWTDSWRSWTVTRPPA